MTNDIYIEAFRRGNIEAVNNLLRMQYPDDDDRLRILEMLDDTGLWSVGWQPGDRGSVKVKAYLGDD